MKKKPLCNAAAVLAALCLPAQPLPASCECVSADLCVQFGSSLLYYSQEAGAWYDAAGSLLTDSTEPVQTALYEGAVYTVDLAEMQVTAADGSVNGELTALLPEYLAFRPVSVWEIDGQDLDGLGKSPGDHRHTAADLPIQQHNRAFLLRDFALRRGHRRNAVFDRRGRYARSGPVVQ